MATWTRVQIEVMARASGWGARSADVSYVAMAESSGDDKVVNSIGCVGLLQINQPVHVGSHPTWTKKWLQNPMNNLAAGLVLYKAAGEKFDGPWLDSRDKGAGGGWGKHVKGSGSTGDTPPDTGSTGSTGTADATQAGVWDTTEGLLDAAGWIANPQNWIRVLYVAGGGVLVIVGIAVIARPLLEKAAGPVIKSVAKGAMP